MADVAEPSEILTETDHSLVSANCDLEQLLFSSQVVANDRDVSIHSRSTKAARVQLEDCGFFAEDDMSKETPQFDKDEEFSDDECSLGDKKRIRRRKPKQLTPSSRQAVQSDDVVLPLPPDQEKPHCDVCDRLFEYSFLHHNFDVDVCDGCHDPKGIHTLITKSTAKERYLLSDTDLDLREPKLRFILKRNPHSSSWMDMRLYLEAQIADRALSIWGSEENLEAERERRLSRVQEIKLKRYSRKIKELKVQTRSSLFMKTHTTHEHSFGPEVYDTENDVYVKRCTTCNYETTFEKL